MVWQDLTVSYLGVVCIYDLFILLIIKYTIIILSQEIDKNMGDYEMKKKYFLSYPTFIVTEYIVDGKCRERSRETSVMMSCIK